MSDSFKTAAAGLGDHLQMTNVSFDGAREFIDREGRLLERRMFAAIFESGPGDGVVDALRGFQNLDGGFGHGLEPDKRCPASLPLDVETAFRSLEWAGVRDEAMVLRACEFLAGCADDGGAVALATPAIEGYPRAAHWAEWAYVPGLNPTAGLVGLLYRLGVEHGWREAAAAYCWRVLESEGLPGDAHSLSETLVFLENVPERDRADGLGRALGGRLGSVAMLCLDPDDPSYGLTPLHLAPEPASIWRAEFSDAVIEAHLDRLERDQQDDGGWPLSWEPPSTAATLEYRGIETIRALRVLTAYDRAAVTKR